jgi:hypothetical protein
MLRTRIPASYWDAAPAAEVATVMEILRRQSEPDRAPGETLVSGGQRR